MMSAVQDLRIVLGRLETALGLISDALVISDENGIITWSNSRFQQLVKRSSLELIGQPIHQSLQTILTNEQSELLELNRWDKTCKERFLIQREPPTALEIERHSITGQSGNASIMQMHDVSSEASNNQLEELIHYLTEQEAEDLPAHVINQLEHHKQGLKKWQAETRPRESPDANRSQLLATLKKQSENTGESHRPIYIMHCKLKDLLDIHYLYGQQAEQRLIQSLTEKAQPLLGEDDRLTQISVDSLVITSSTISSLPEAVQLGEHLHNIFSQPVSWEGHTIASSVSIGITRSSKKGEGFDALLMQAQQTSEAMKNRSGVSLFQPNL